MNYLIFIVLVIFAIFTGTLVEFFKKVIFKDKTTKGVNIIFALLFSFIFAIVSFFTIDICTLVPGVKMGFGIIVVYTAIIYLLQKPICLKIIKKLFRQFLTKKGYNIKDSE
jgi:membrane protein YdbS with pleckstrin-like domain